jgi:hypothetical protein
MIPAFLKVFVVTPKIRILLFKINVTKLNKKPALQSKAVKTICKINYLGRPTGWAKIALPLNPINCFIFSRSILPNTTYSDFQKHNRGKYSG